VPHVVGDALAPTAQLEDLILYGGLVKDIAQCNVVILEPRITMGSYMFRGMWALQGFATRHWQKPEQNRPVPQRTPCIPLTDPKKTRINSIIIIALIDVTRLAALCGLRVQTHAATPTIDLCPTISPT
jgi:hypothetical protein